MGDAVRVELPDVVLDRRVVRRRVPGGRAKRHVECVGMRMGIDEQRAVVQG